MPWLAGVQGVRQSSRRKTSGKEDLREAKSSWALLTWRVSRVGGCNGSGGEGGGVDEVAFGNIDEEVKVSRKLAPIRGMQTSTTMNRQVKVLSLKESRIDLYP